MSTKQKQLILAIGLGVVVAILNKYYVNSRISEYQEAAGRQIRVARATQRLEPGMELTNDMVDRVPVPELYAPRTRIRDVDLPQYLGQKLAMDVAKGDYILSSHFTPIMTVGRKLSDQLAGQDLRAITIPVDDNSSLSRSIMPGDKIDVIFSFSTPPLKQKFSTLLFQNVPVIATGGYSASEQELGTGGGRARTYGTITLRLPVLDALRLNYARTEGKISVILRYPGDNNVISMPPIATIQDLLSPADQEMLKNAKVEQERSSEMGEARFREQIKSLMDQQRQQKAPGLVGGGS